MLTTNSGSICRGNKYQGSEQSVKVTGVQIPQGSIAITHAFAPLRETGISTRTPKKGFRFSSSSGRGSCNCGIQSPRNYLHPHPTAIA
ncbi:tRNA-specific adenosine-34 deaminase subunit Tad3 [Histoplasma capsulatum G186AR]|uniref:tRNA-specific adenosine-34 deaminase subunit Tad3 n=1 Tax=Ajellomyces capsulatus TaxID=5037 RepID=A0A8H7YJS8_AJECA|nr:tRNA-specific adenosine-34 deaminase subunit Tad3 [Histoplasma capsulatum]QSS75117.1 tRNA-specific adenosine-34 deaminase subunit Tad3 [Histoplasma capsulatum G186AR]